MVAPVCSVAGAPHAPNRILHDFPDILRNIIRNIRNDMRKEIRIMILLKPPGGEYRRRSFLKLAALWLGKKF